MHSLCGSHRCYLLRARSYSVCSLLYHYHLNEPHSQLEKGDPTANQPDPQCSVCVCVFVPRGGYPLRQMRSVVCRSLQFVTELISKFPSEGKENSSSAHFSAGPLLPPPLPLLLSS